MLLQVFFAVTAIWVLIVRCKNKKFRKICTQVKCDIKSLPLVGHAYMFIGDDEDRMSTFQKVGLEAIKQGGITTIWMINRLYIMIADPEIAELILKTNLEKDDVTKFTQVAFRNGSIFAPVSIWRPRRKILAPNFNLKNLNQFVKIFSEQSAIMADQLNPVAGTGPFSVWNYLTTYTMDSVCETTLGVQVNAQKDPNQPFLKAFDVFCQLVAERMCKPWLYSDKVYKLLPVFRKLKNAVDYMTTFTDKVIKAKRKEIKEKLSNKSDHDQKAKQESMKTFLEMLIESSGGVRGYTDLELQEETLVIVMAGTDTSAVGAAFTTVMLSRYLHVQDKVYDELQEVFGDSTRPVETADLPRLKYLDAVIRETLRLYPPVPITARKITTDVTLPSGVTVPSGCGAVINVWAIHRNPRYWGCDVEHFRPERFIDPAFEHPAQFIPFSYGPRNCLGYQYAMMSMKTALATLLRRYRVLPVTSSCPPCDEASAHSYPHKDKPLRVKFDIMMKDVENFQVQIESRF